ncbi:hypothetical protein F443_14813 [Phytophthora nicotianae P1569]|uniref:Uncharacterized protein n=1 Tax=Phytophthora nicotianae P1569 TaxID=1317065 RepID=V9EK37_PHYNI|nr:hypothetical protein F443_14813 [Phytophthora nicotianae P1569]
MQLSRAFTSLSEEPIKFGLSPRDPTPASTIFNGKTTYLLDRSKQSVYSEFIRRTNMQLPAFVRLLCGETSTDRRPKKHIDVPTQHPAWKNYIFISQ